jgi:serine/threonine-protein kinase
MRVEQDAPMAETAQTSSDSLVGRLVVERGLATSEEVQRCIELQRQQTDASDQSLAGLLIREGVITQPQLDRLKPQLEQQQPEMQIPGYQVLAKLGSGAMATVYKAKQLSLDRLVAIKVLPRKYTKNAEFVERLYAEGRAAAKLNHANIVGALDVGKAGEFHYFVMEYVEGSTVFDHITQHGRYPETEALKIMLQVARALQHAHDQGFIHRDVKPKNIMITPEGQVKLADMGLARAVSDREAAEAEQGKAFGTPYYISPEQIRGEVDVDFRADIYGLGATLYHMVTGRVPYNGPNPSAVMHQHLKAELVPPDHINNELTRGISEIIEVCLNKDRDQRYVSTADLVQDLESVLEGDVPYLARKLVDLDSLSALEQSSGETAELATSDGGSLPIVMQPLFWFAVIGWVVAVALILVLITSG